MTSVFFISPGAPPAPEPAPELEAPNPSPARMEVPPPPVHPVYISGLLSDADERHIADRNYGPVIQRLLERHRTETSPHLKAALSRVGLKLSSAAKVASQYRTAVAQEKNPSLRLRDGRLSSYAFTPVPSVQADSIVEYARRSPEVTELDLAFFLLIDGEALSALDHILIGRELRPECRAHAEDLVESALLQKRDAREIQERLASVRDRLPAGAAARVDAALRK